MDKKPKALALRAAEEVKDMVFGYHNRNDIIFGRMPVGLEVSEFDALPTLASEIDRPELAEVDEVVLGDPDPFEEEEEHFPTFKDALARFEDGESASRIARIDNDATYNAFVCERALKEIDRRVRELRTAVEEHLSDPHGGKIHTLRAWDEILGAAEAITDLRRAPSSDAAVSAMPSVLVDIPDYAVGKVKCWRDGDSIVCSMRFEAADGSPRIATVAARPQVNADALAEQAARAGIEPVTLLGVLPDLAEAACGKRLLRDTARAALRAREREDVLGMADEPVMLVSEGNTGMAPLAAMMEVQQRAEAGDPQAQLEVRKFHKVAQQAPGLKPLLVAAKTRLDRARQHKVRERRPSFMKRYALLGMYV